MSDDLRDVLDRVAAGEISPEEAQRLLAASSTPSGEPEPDPDAEPVRRIVVRARAVRLIISGEVGVDSAVADGPHRVQRSGGVLTIHSDLRVGEVAEPPRSLLTGWLSNAQRAGSTLTVRVNPDLPLEVLNVAGSVEAHGMRAATSVGVEAGSARLYDGVGPVVLSVATGSADVEWQFQGQCSVSAELGSARVTAMPGSDVSIVASATMGVATVRLADGTTLKATPEGHPPVLAGAGTGRLDATARLGSLTVTVMS
ncbi:MAG: hypothetical protein WCF36_05300 [Candidatus Nanopelagicales bacterium]